MEISKKSHCRYLRAKRAYIPGCEDPESWRSGDSSTQQYWCLRTMTTAGSDDDVVAPELCQPGRSCYKAVELEA